MVGSTQGRARGWVRAVMVTSVLAALLAPVAVAVVAAAPEALAAPPPVGTLTHHAPFASNGINAPVGLAQGGDGAMWFTNSGNSTIGRTTSAGVVTNYQGSGISTPTAMAAGPAGDLWFVNAGNATLGRITTAGVVSNFADPALQGVSQLTAGPDGAVWFTRPAANVIGRIDAAGAVTTFSDPQLAVSGAITLGADGALWFANGTHVGRMTTAGAVTQYDVAEPAPGPGPSHVVQGVTAGPGGAVYFTSYAEAAGLGYSDGRVGKITTGGVITTNAAQAGQHPGKIVAAPDGFWLWYIDLANATLVQVRTDLTNNSQGPNHDHPADLAPGPDGGVWWTVSSTNTIMSSAKGSTPVATQDKRLADAVAVAPDGSTWFTIQPSTIARRAVDGTVTERTVPGTLFANSMPYTTPALDPTITSLVIGGDGSVWFAGYDHDWPTITRIAPDGTFSESQVQQFGVRALELAAGPDGAVWFLMRRDSDQPRVGRVTPTGMITYFSGAVPNKVRAISAAGDGALWFTTDVDVLGRMALDGTVTTRAGSFWTGSLSTANRITTGADGALWFALQTSPVKVVRLDVSVPNAAFQTFATTSTGLVSDIAVGPDGQLWLSLASGVVGHMKANGQYTAETLPTPTVPYGIAAGLDGGVWFAERGAPATAGTGSMLGRLQALPSTATAPPAPRVYASAGDGQLQATWTATDGGAALTGVTVTLSPGGATCTWSSGPPSCSFSGLTNGTAYTATARATNAIGTSSVSPLSATVTPHQRPAAPAFPTARNSTFGCVDVSWWPPAGAPVLEVLIRTFVSGQMKGEWWYPAAGNTQRVCPPIPSGGPDTQPVTFTVAVRTAVDISPMSPSTAPVMSGAPTTPARPVAHPGDGSALVQWSSAANPYYPAYGYVVTPYRNGLRQPDITFPNDNRTSQLLTGLTNGATYTFTVSASAGATSAIVSSPSTASAPVVVGQQEAPAFPAASPGAASARVSWWPTPMPTTGVVITPSKNGVPQAPVTILGSNLSVVDVPGLTNGASYTFTVATTNSVGTSPTSVPTAPIVVGPPAAPAFPTAVTGDGRATVSWWPTTLPTTGSIITPYLDGVAQTPVAFNDSASSHVVTGLLNGRTYTFTVALVNAVGPSPTSTTAPLLIGTPSTPAFVTPTVVNGEISLRWWPVTANGSPLTGGTIEVYVSDYPSHLYAIMTFTGAGFVQAVTNIVHGSHFTFRVQVTNAVGTSAWSAMSAPILLP